MALAIQKSRTPSVKGRLLSTLIMAFALMLQPMYGVVAGQVANAVSPDTFHVSTEADLRDKLAIANPGDYIVLGADINISEPLVLSRPGVSIYGQGHTVSYSPGAYTNGWNSEYVLHVYRTTGIHIRNIKLTGGDAGLLVNGSQVGLFSDAGYGVDVSGNEFGGIEVSRGDGVTETPKLTIHSGTNLVNSTETATEPTVWTDKYVGTDWIKDLRSSSALSTLINPTRDTQRYYYLSPAKITNVDAYYTKRTGYTAISVDFKTENITNATKVELRVNRVGEENYSVAAKQSVIDAINSTSPKTTTGSIIIDGKRTSGSWNNQVGTWAGEALPESVDVIITLADGTVLTESDDVISTSKATQSEVIPSEVSNVVLNGESVNVARGYNCGPTDFNHVRGKINLSANITDISSVKSVKYNVRKVNESGCTQTNIYKSSTVSMNNPSGDSWVTVPGTELNAADMPEDGTYTVQMIVTDNDNNVTTRYVDIFVDNAAPVVSDVTITPMTDDNVVGGEVKVSFTMTDASEINFHKNLTHVRFTNGRDAGGNTISSAAYAVQRDGTSDRYFAMVDTRDFVPLGTVADNFRVYVRAEDKVGAGNQAGAAFFKNQITIDNQAPAAPVITSPSDGQEFTVNVGGDIIRAEWTEVADAVEYEIKYEYTRSGNRVTDTRRTANLYRSQSLSGGALSDFVIQVRARDAVGNWSDWSAPVTYYYGVEAPVEGDGDDGETDTGGETGASEEESVVSEGTSSDNEDEDEEVETSSQAFPNPIFAFGNQGILGDQDEVEANPVDDSEVEGEVAGEQDETGTPLSDTAAFGMDAPKLLGLVWYWWVAILAAIVGGWLLIAAAIRRSREEEA